jgi:hypothetical protein
VKLLRAIAAAWLVIYGLDLRLMFSLRQLRSLLEARPELAVGALVLESLPAVVGAAYLLRRVRPDLIADDGPFAAAGRWAALLAIAGLALPLHAPFPEAVLGELELRALAFVGLALMVDGPLEPRR